MTHDQSITSVGEVTTTTLERALEELDQVIHRSKAILQHARKSSVEERLRAWKAIKGLWKDRTIGDAIEYQRKMRDEFEEHSGV